MRWILLLCFASAAVCQLTNVADRNALLSFCQPGVSNVEAALGWCVDADPCAWTGVTCATRAGALRVIQIAMPSAPAVGGTFPQEFRGLSRLEMLSIAQSTFTGTVPPQFFTTSGGSLTHLTIRNSPLLGFDAGLLRSLSAIEEIALVDTRVSGALNFRAADHWINPVSLEISYSQLDAVQDDFFEDLPLLERAVLRNNRIAGSAPSSLCLAPVLRVIDFANNRLTVFPACFEAINALVVERCNFQDNYFCESARDPADFLPCLVDAMVNAVVDACGVCAGTDECLDCAGVRDGTAVLDACSVCGGDGSTCLDCAGVSAGTAVYDACDLCAGDNSVCSDCAGVPNGPAAYDVCDVCAGDGTSCIDCTGVLNGSSAYDACGVCDGDGLACLDCNGVAFGTDFVDACGDCGGLGAACTDCAGVANGSAVYDRCDVCGGDDSLCGIDGLKHQSSTLKTWSLIFVALLALFTLICACWALSCCSPAVAAGGGAGGKTKKCTPNCRNLKLHDCAFK